MSNTIYIDIPYQAHRLEHTPGYTIIAEIYNEEGRLIAALFVVEEEAE